MGANDQPSADVEFKASAMHEEKLDHDQLADSKVDPHGYPLRPQPTDDRMDPLNWPYWIKMAVLIQVSFLAFLGPFCQAVINSAFVPLSKAMHISVTVASYNTTIAILFAGVSPIIWSPIANIYGRRPIFIAVTALGIAAQCACAVAPHWSGILIARAFVGIGTSAGMGIGAAVVADLFFTHERGKYTGIYIVFVTNGAHLAAVVGGFTALNKHLGWRWCYWVPAFIFAGTWVVMLFCLPETLYHRDNKTGESHMQGDRTWFQLLTFRGVTAHRKLKLSDFGHVFVMLRYPSVLLPTIYYSISFGLGSVLFAVTGAAAFGSIYKFNTAQIGMAIGLSTFIGTLIGELLAGPVSDRILYIQTKRSNGAFRPEARLQAIWPGFFLCPAGVIIEGVCLQYKTHWAGPVIGIGIAAFGLQIISTNIFAYCTDCYKPQSAEISTLLNFGRQTFSFTLGFYMVPFAHATSYGVAWSVLAIINACLFTGIVLLMWRGKHWRESLGSPNFDKDL
ncbi:hypothetical protein BAUCODRAFT_32515 [Baudoinia panamericana UAMH 10762]|uniref:Major facilitator superfamily (MFS) profile domain-containing protein n=1 Tax=Baudoinia panamericana (strain UAMH 10762) TaxID=717646 RepID=M2NHG7_BAUPA|nr:uncharacterized protein BAUCODRAFT_32515 [Baudoinia panamericana UAMH 10762]EMC98470.1 hypothetical protein BAUCODRAFT_32515 [Baudoinia panamericana UAMH 10762]